MSAFTVFLLSAFLSFRAESVASRPPLRAFCSIMAGGELGSAKTTLFIGTSTSDSLPANKPRFRSSLRGEPNVVNGPAYSQIIYVERLSSSVPPSLRKALTLANNRVLVIPWSYGPDCSTITYEGSALWLKPVTRALFGAVLRPQAEWVKGIPTFDTGHPRNTPYPVAEAYDREAPQHQRLSPDTLLSLLDWLPRRTTEATDVVARYLASRKRSVDVLRWAAQHPQQANLWPASMYVSGAKYVITTAAYDTIISPIAGTYRFVIDIPGRDSIVFFGATMMRPNTLLWSERPGDSSPQTPPPYGYNLLVTVAESPSGKALERPRGRQGYLTVALEPRLASRDSTVWAAGLDLIRTASEIVEDSSSKRALIEIDNKYFAQLRAGTTGFTPGRIVRLHDGSVNAALVIKDRDTVLATIRATRISRKTFARPSK